MKSDVEILADFNAKLDRNLDRVVYGYRYFKSKIENYISISNLRLEVVQIKGSKILYTLAAPVLQVSHNKNKILYVDKDLVIVTDGPRANIVLRNCYLNDGEAASPVSHFGTQEVTADSDIKLIRTVMDRLTGPSWQRKHREGFQQPQYFRCTKNPARMRLNFAPDLLQKLSLPATANAEEIVI